MQSSYEVVRRAIEFDTPDRLPIRFDSLGISDIRTVNWNQIGTGDHNFKQTVDEWGCTWQRSEAKNMGQVKGHPLLNWHNMDSYMWPDPNNPEFYNDMDRKLENADEKYITTGIFMLLFERMHALHGFENTLSDLLLEKEKIEFLADKIVEINIQIIENIAGKFPGRIHGFSFTDDWGTQENLFIKPLIWEEFFKPRYKKMFDTIHASGWHVWMHSCGKITPILENLIDIGLNVINLQQPRALGIEEVGGNFAGKICFESLCDIQHTLPFKDNDEITEEAELLLISWGTPAGGFILSDYGDGRAIGVPLDKKEVMLRAFLERDPYKRRTIQM